MSYIDDQLFSYLDFDEYIQDFVLTKKDKATYARMLESKRSANAMRMRAMSLESVTKAARRLK